MLFSVTTEFQLQLLLTEMTLVKISHRELAANSYRVCILRVNTALCASMCVYRGLYSTDNVQVVCDSFMDRLIQRYDVYKVETISSVYMCVSGIPIRNGQRHVTEIARMSLDIINAAKRFHIASMPEVRLNLRVGAHTGERLRISVQHILALMDWLSLILLLDSVG